MPLARSSINTAAEATDASFNGVDHISWDSIPFVCLSLLLCLHCSAAIGFLHVPRRSSPAPAAVIGGGALAALPASGALAGCEEYIKTSQ